MIASMSENGSRQSVFVYDPLSLGQEIAEYDGNSDLSAATVQRIYLRLPGSVDQPFLMIDYAGAGCGGSGCEHWAYADQRGSIIATTDENGDIRNQYAYSPYGVTNDEGGIPFKYTGQKYDSQSGLYYYKARWYDPETGKFLQPDPIGYGDGMNMYAYVGGDPVNLSDPTGLASCETGSRLGGGGHCTQVISLDLLRQGGGGGGGGSSSTSVCIDGASCVSSSPITLSIFPGTSIADSLSIGSSRIQTPENAFGEFVDCLVNGASEGQCLAVDRTTPDFCRLEPSACGGANDLTGDMVALFAGGPIARGIGLGIASFIGRFSPTAGRSLALFFPANNGFSGSTSEVFLFAGQRIGRFGGSGSSRFFTNVGVGEGALSLPPFTAGLQFNTFRVIKPFPVQVGRIAPAFGQFGGGTQFITPVPLETLIRRGVITGM